jgi:hypothetical protein
VRKIKQNILAQIFIIYTRYLIGAAFVFASVVKVKGERFTSVSGADEPIDSAWHLFETLYASGLFWKFIGAGQLIAGFLLMTQRYSKLGALMFLPILVSVFIVTISYYFALTPVITGLMLFANIMLVLWDWDELKVLVNKVPIIETTKRLENQKIWEITGLVLFLFTVFYRAVGTSYNILLWGVVCLTIGLAGLVIGLIKNKRYSNAEYA